MITPYRHCSTVNSGWWLRIKIYLNLRKWRSDLLSFLVGTTTPKNLYGSWTWTEIVWLLTRFASVLVVWWADTDYFLCVTISVMSFTVVMDRQILSLIHALGVCFSPTTNRQISSQTYYLMSVTPWEYIINTKSFGMTQANSFGTIKNNLFFTTQAHHKR